MFEIGKLYKITEDLSMSSIDGEYVSVVKDSILTCIECTNPNSIYKTYCFLFENKKIFGLEFTIDKKWFELLNYV